jgi:archaellum component FlaC
MQMGDFDMEFGGDLKARFRALEEQLSEATHRSLGGLRTEDQKFAFAVEVQTRDTLRFMDRLERLFEEIIESCNSQIDEAETERNMMEEKLARIETFIADFQRMENIKKIIRE